MSLIPDDRSPFTGRALEVDVWDYHTGGEPFRIVTGGVPAIPGATVLERRAWIAANLDQIRKLLVNEPRGHADMYGGFVVPPNDKGADLGVIFFHNEGYSTACGHGTIALATWAVEQDVVPVTEPVTTLTIDVPSGRLQVEVLLDEGRVQGVSFVNVPSFVRAQVDLQLGGAPVTMDIAFGGAFYGIMNAGELGVRVHAADLPEIIQRCRSIKNAINDTFTFVHPEVPELAEVYGIILVEEVSATSDELHQRNVTVFADGEVDRSATGSGTSARLALLHSQGRLADGRRLFNESIVGSHLIGEVIGETSVGDYPAVSTRISGQAFVCGTTTFILDPADPLGTGFLLR